MAEMIPPLYRPGKVLGSAAISFYFSRVEIWGGGHVPSEGPVIFAANHPNSVTDSLLLGFSSRRIVRFLGHSGLFRWKWRAFLLRQAGVIPVYRPTDRTDASEKNRSVFRECTALLEQGGALGIFPEGRSAPVHGILPLKTGMARIALETEDRNGFRLGVVVVPVGISFESRGRFRSAVLVSFGEPIDARGYEESWRRDPREAVHALTDAVGERIRERVMNLGREDMAVLVNDVEAVYREELAARAPRALRDVKGLKRKQVLSREIARAVDFFTGRDPHMVWDFGNRLRRYRARLAEIDLTDRQLRDERSRSVRNEAFRAALFAAAGFPVALYGLFWNIIPYKITGRAAWKAAPDSTQYHQFQIVFGLLFYILYYFPLVYVLYRWHGGRIAAAMALSFIPTGFFARWYAREVSLRRRSLRFAWLSATKELLIKRLRRQRRLLTEEIDRLVEEYLREAPPGESRPGREKRVEP